MLSDAYLKEQKISKLKEIADVPEEEIAKMSYKEKQAVYRAKSKLCNVFHRGGTYRKAKNENIK